MLTALITGTSTGIGRATALKLARSGLTVWATMRDPSMGASLRSIADDEGLDLRILQLDVEDEGSVQAAFEQTGGIDVLVNNAGICWSTRTANTSESDAEAQFDTNFKGPIRMSSAVTPHMLSQQACTVSVSNERLSCMRQASHGTFGKSKIVNIGSAGGHKTVAGTKCHLA